MSCYCLAQNCDNNAKGPNMEEGALPPCNLGTWLRRRKRRRAPNCDDEEDEDDADVALAPGRRDRKDEGVARAQSYSRTSRGLNFSGDEPRRATREEGKGNKWPKPMWLLVSVWHPRMHDRSIDRSFIRFPSNIISRASFHFRNCTFFLPGDCVSRPIPTMTITPLPSFLPSFSASPSIRHCLISISTHSLHRTLIVRAFMWQSFGCVATCSQACDPLSCGRFLHQ